MNMQEIIEKWMMNDRDTTPLWRLPIGEIDYDPPEDPTDGVEIAALAENIRQCGLIHPILVEKQTKGKKYRLIAGRRRLEALTLLGRTHIGAIVVKCDHVMPLKIALSENFMRKAPHYLDYIRDIQTLLKIIPLDELARLFSVKEALLQEKLTLTVLSPYEKRLVRLLDLKEDEALELCKIENSTLRKLILEKIMESGDSIDRASLISQAAKSPDFRLTQCEKIFVRDIRVFLNSVERAAEMMRSAGFDTLIERKDSGESYQFVITVAKNKAELHTDKSVSASDNTSNRSVNVSRETSSSVISKRANVSRETHKIPAHSLDESDKSCYNKEVTKQIFKLQ